MMFRKSMRHAIDGIIYTIKSERNFRIHLIILTFIVLISIFFNISKYEWMMIILTSSIVLLAEMINTAVEKTLDWLEPNHHDVVKIVKDVCAGAVLICAVSAVLVGIFIFTPYIFNY